MKRGLQKEQVVLEDGRKLSYIVDRASGDKDENTVWIFFLPGMFSKSNDFVYKEPFSLNSLYVDRPGYGKSDPVPDASTWTYGKFARDVEQLADHLKIEKYLVAGHSSGGPCALACGYHSANRVFGVMPIAGDPEYTAPGAPKEAPSSWLLYRCVVPSLIGIFCCCFSGRLGGSKVDYYVERRSYDFSAEDIAVPTLFLQGARDTSIPPEYTQFTHDRVKNSELMMIDAADHITIANSQHIERALQRLLEMTASSEATTE